MVSARCLNGVVHVPYADPYRPVFDFRRDQGDYGDACVDYLENVVFKFDVPADEVAAILLEPIQGEGGYVVPAPRFLPRLRELCNKHGILLIVWTKYKAVWAHGKWWAVENFTSSRISCAAPRVSRPACRSAR